MSSSSSSSSSSAPPSADAIPISPTSILLSNKEILTEEFLKSFLEGFEQRNGSFSDLPADLSIQEQLLKAEQELSECSILFSHKYNPIVKAFIKAQFEKHLNARYGVIAIEMEDEETMADMYLNCYWHFISDFDSIHFAALDRSLIKNIHMADYFTLMFYSMSTVKRQEGDNCLSLLIVGASSTGKTAIFESPLQQVSHNFTNESGVGRFNCNGKSVLLLHDVPINVLTRARDMEKLKAIARTEPVSVKVHSKTISLSPIFIVATSNQLLYSHRFKHPERKGINFKTFYTSDIQPSPSMTEADTKAIKYRFIEMMVRQRPIIPSECIPKSGTFKRNHLIKGLYGDIVFLLEDYNRDDFGSEYVFLYALIALSKNFPILSLANQALFKPKLTFLIHRYRLSEKQKKQCMDYIEA